MASCINKVVLSLLMFSILSGCATLAPRQPKDFWARLDGIKLGDIIDTSTGKPVSFPVFIQQVSKCRIVYVGHAHTGREDHEVQLKVLQGIHAVSHAVLALEMFPREKQSEVDRFFRGDLTEQQFLKEVDLQHFREYPFEFYRDIVLFARDNRIPILALNAPPDVIGKIAREGLASLAAEERQRIAGNLRLHNSPYRKVMKTLFQDQSPNGIKSFETFYEAQLAREKTLAETLAQALQRHGEHVTIVALIGKGHITHGMGVPKWTASMVPHSYKTVSPMPLNHPHSVVDPKLGHYVWITDARPVYHR